MILKKASFSLMLLLFTLYAFGQDADFFKPDPHRRELKAVKITGNIKVDGVLDEPEWNLTLGASEFIQVEPFQGKPSKFVTIVKVLYNQKYLYFGIICKDPQGR